MRIAKKRTQLAVLGLWLRPLFWALYCTSIILLTKFWKEDLQIPMAVPSIIGTAIALFLGFRTNSAYQRWWEARKIWGEIINNSRTLTRQVLTYTAKNPSHKIARRIARRQIAWSWTLARTLREQDWKKEATTYLEEEDFQKLLEGEHKGNLLLLQQAEDLRKLVHSGEMDKFDFRQIDETLTALCNSMGKCERIKKTVFPTRYALFTLVFINIFQFLLPLGMAVPMGYLSIPVHMVVGFTFGMIQEIARSMQDPFEDHPNSIPMNSICRSIERNILELLGNKELPEPLKPVKRILM